MISALELIPKIEAALDAEGSDRYSFERDYKFAINYAVEFWISVMNSLLGDNKLSEENVRELVKTKVFQTSKYSRIHFDQTELNEEIWSIIAIYPEPVLDPALDPLVNPTPENSIFVPDTVFVESDYDAARLTPEQWSKKNKNVFMQGSKALVDTDFKNYSYRNFSTDRPGDDPTEIIEEIEISPSLDNQLVAVKYVTYPTPIENESDIIPFPKTMSNLMIVRALKFISFKQGDGTNLWKVSSEEMSQLAGIMS